MRRAYCPNCGSVRPFRRAFGWGTFFAVVLTFGWWLLALPFYPIRCTNCGLKYKEQQAAARGDTQKRPWSGRDGLMLLAILAAILVVAMLAVQSGR